MFGYNSIYRLFFLFITGWCIASCTDSAAQPQKFDYWRANNGLPQNSINTIIQDHKGYLWMGSDGGLVRFDGVKFKVYNVSQYPQLESNRIIILLEDHNNNILIGSFKGGLSLFRDNKITNLSDSFGVKNLSVFSLLRDSKNRLWVSTIEKGTIVLDGTNYKRIKGFETLSSCNSAVVYEVADDEYLLVSDFRILLWKKGKLYDADDPRMRAYPVLVAGFLYDTFNKYMWIVSNGELYKYQNHTFLEKYKLPTLSSNKRKVFKLFKIDDDKLIISIQGGKALTEFDITSGKFTPTKPLEIDCSTGTIRSIIKDAENNRWYASTLCGLIKEKKNIFEYVDYKPGIEVHNIYPIIIDHKKRILFGTNAGGFYLLDSNKVYNYSSRTKANIDDFVYSLAEGDPGQYYVGTISYAEIHMFDKSGVHSVRSANGKSVGTKAIYKSKSGEILVGGAEGIFTVTGDRLSEHHLSRHFSKDNVTGFLEDHQDNLWIMSDLGIHRYGKGAYTYFGERTGLKARFFRGSYEDSTGRLYFGSYGYGLIIYNNGSFRIINSGNGLKEDVVSTITEDTRGNIWLTGNIGLSRIKKHELDEYLAGSRKNINTILYNRDDGLISSEFNGGFQQAKCKLAEDVYLYPTLEGCVKVDFNKIAENNIPPPVHIEEVSVNDSVYLISDSRLAVPYSDGRLEIFYTALSYVSPKNVRFRYKLERYDKDWIDAGTERKTSYTKLPPGNYTFKVIACNNEGVWNETGDKLQLVIIPPFYMTWWFYSLMVVAFCMIIILIGYYFIKSVKTKEANRVAFMNVLPDLLLRMNRQGKYIDVLGNEKELVLPFEEIRGKLPREVLSPSLAMLVTHHHNAAFRTGRLQVFEYRLTHIDGRTVDYEGRMVAVNRFEVLYIIRDVTERKKAEQALQDNQEQLMNLLDQKNMLIEENKKQQIERLNAIVETQEAERERIANDLHDGIAQMLSLLKINLSVIEEWQKDSNRAQETINATHKLVDSITADLKNVSYNLMPSSLSKFGLMPAVEELAERMQYHSEVKFRFSKHITRISFDPKIDVNIYRIIQELVNNTLKHSGATEIQLQIVEHEDMLAITFENNGMSFDPMIGQNKHESKGLKNIFSRVRTINGAIQFDTQRNGAIVITLEIPIPLMDDH